MSYDALNYCWEGKDKRVVSWKNHIRLKAFKMILFRNRHFLKNTQMLTSVSWSKSVLLKQILYLLLISAFGNSNMLNIKFMQPGQQM